MVEEIMTDKSELGIQNMVVQHSNKEEANAELYHKDNENNEKKQMVLYTPKSNTKDNVETMEESLVIDQEEKKEDDASMTLSSDRNNKEGGITSVITTPMESCTNDENQPSDVESDQSLDNVPSSVEMMKKKTKNRKNSTSNKSITKKQHIPTKQVTQRWCLNQEQIDLCFSACMDHYETVMRTVKSRDLHRELQDGFDVLRERGFGRYDMELPAFDDTNTFGFLTDPTKAPWMPVVKAILGDDAILIHKGCFLSMPGSAPQEYHQDGVHLTTQTQRPCHAINVFIPLVDLNSRNGPTEFCLGSHILGLEGYDRDFVEVPKPKAGTPVIFDYRLGHRGLGNNSSRSCRPIVYCTYARAAQGKEFRDSVNFSRKRYHKIGELCSKPLSREERCNKRKKFLTLKEDEDLKRALEESMAVSHTNSSVDNSVDDDVAATVDADSDEQGSNMINTNQPKDVLDDNEGILQQDMKRVKVDY